jgi:hypothetical protein
MAVDEHLRELTRDDMRDLGMTLGDIKRLQAYVDSLYMLLC